MKSDHFMPLDVTPDLVWYTSRAIPSRHPRSLSRKNSAKHPHLRQQAACKLCGHEARERKRTIKSTSDVQARLKECPFRELLLQSTSRNNSEEDWTTHTRSPAGTWIQDPAGARLCFVEACCQRKHAGQAEALHHGQQSVHSCESGGARVPTVVWRKAACGFAELFHGDRAKPPQDRGRTSRGTSITDSHDLHSSSCARQHP
jgi:hypothetical protein